MSQNKKSYRSEFSQLHKQLPRPTLVVRRGRDGSCLLPGINVECMHNYNCYACGIAHRARVSFGYDPPPYPVIDARSCVPESSKKQLSYYGKVVLLKPEALERLELPQLLYFQFFKCTGGYGCHPGNDVWEVDGYLLGQRDRSLTLRRLDIIGIPTLTACKDYDKKFLALSAKECGYDVGGDAYDCYVAQE